MIYDATRNSAARIVVAIAFLFAADVALGQQYYTLNTGSSVAWNTTLWTGGAGGVPPQTSTQVGLFTGGGTVAIDATSTNTTPGGMLVGWNAGNFTVNVTGGTLTVGSTAGDAGGGFGLTLGESSGRTGTLTQSGGLVTSPIVRANQGTGAYNLNSGTLQTQQIFSRGGPLTFNFGGGTLVATGTSSTGLTGTSGVTMVVNAGGGTIDNGGFATVLNAPISGSGNLTLAGSGTTTYLANNTHSGTTTLSAGTLQIGNGGTTGSIAGNVVNDAALLFDRSDNITFSGTISGNGTLTKRNANTLTLSSTSIPFTGSIALSSGTLRLTSNAASTTLAATITGSGGLVRDAASNATGSFLVLTGSNSYSGGTTINAGFVQLGTNNALGTGPLAFTADAVRGSLNMQGFDQTIAGLSATNTNASRGDIYNQVSNATSTLTIDTPTGQSFAYANQIGAIATLQWGDINVVKSGAGTQTFSGNNLYTGSTSITGGRLVIASTGLINQTSGITINGSGAELAYNSATALTRPFTFTQGTISGTGTIGTAVVVGANAILSPGNSPGAQAYSSGLTWNPGGTYTWEINDAAGVVGTNWDVLNVSGGALDLSGLSVGNTFNLDLTTLTGTASGPMANYVDGQAYTFALATYASLSLPVGFSGDDLTSLFSLSFANWANPVPSLANASVVNDPATGTINLVVVPEPNSLALAVMAVAAAGWKLRRSNARDSRTPQLPGTIR